MWSSSGYLQEILMNIIAGCNRGDDPVLGDDSVCVEWHGNLIDEDELPVIDIYQPIHREGAEGEPEFEKSTSHVNRVLVFLYADDSSFQELESRTETLTMACGNPRCVNLTHISLDE